MTICITDEGDLTFLSRILSDPPFSGSSRSWALKEELACRNTVFFLDFTSHYIYNVDDACACPRHVRLAIARLLPICPRQSNLKDFFLPGLLHSLLHRLEVRSTFIRRLSRSPPRPLSRYPRSPPLERRVGSKNHLSCRSRCLRQT